jgi:hypothetical protein
LLDGFGGSFIGGRSGVGCVGGSISGLGGGVGLAVSRISLFILDSFPIVVPFVVLGRGGVDDSAGAIVFLKRSALLVRQAVINVRFAHRLLLGFPRHAVFI